MSAGEWCRSRPSLLLNSTSYLEVVRVGPDRARGEKLAMPQTGRLGIGAADQTWHLQHPLGRRAIRLKAEAHYSSIPAASLRGLYGRPPPLASVMHVPRTEHADRRSTGYVIGKRGLWGSSVGEVLDGTALPVRPKGESPAKPVEPPARAWQSQCFVGWRPLTVECHPGRVNQPLLESGMRFRTSELVLAVRAQNQQGGTPKPTS